ncbi:MAG: hypothetical protein A2Y64_08035 [Candidatus Coatesbacteria bacterium RBG_13_66_14]|uniref:FlgD Ig-like domain-containing protein n=1 Tax=Candidatus Coatesbacteria bacterium RBG_13_66_14 TaxID=1817816 RepID=A0A1F5FJ93_9BACT|nr:MAG: hypothetical protein A2Y64_08035 [Candidatus Coatesbacteria bacterium RBG_13_66_14]
MMRIAFVLLVVMTPLAWANSMPEITGHGFAYPTPWVCGDGELTFRLETIWELPSPIVFVVIDTAGDEVIRVEGGPAGAQSIYGYSFFFEAVWDGRNADGRLVAPGTYICYVEGVSDSAFRFIVTR